MLDRPHSRCRVMGRDQRSQIGMSRALSPSVGVACALAAYASALRLNGDVRDKEVDAVAVEVSAGAP